MLNFLAELIADCRVDIGIAQLKESLKKKWETNTHTHTHDA